MPLVIPLSTQTTQAAFVNFASSGADTNTSNKSVTKPSGVLAGHVGVFQLTRWNSANSFPAVTKPAGAVQLGSQVAIVSGGGGFTATDVFAVVVGAETSYAFSWSGSEWNHLDAQFWSGCDTTLAHIPAPSQATVLTGTTYPSPSIDANAGDALAWFANTNGYTSATTHTPPTSFTETFDVSPATSAYRVAPSTGTQTPAGGSHTVSQESIVTLVRIPAAVTTETHNVVASVSSVGSVAAPVRKTGGLAAGVASTGLAGSGERKTGPALAPVATIGTLATTHTKVAPVAAGAASAGTLVGAERKTGQLAASAATDAAVTASQAKTVGVGAPITSAASMAVTAAKTAILAAGLASDGALAVATGTTEGAIVVTVDGAGALTVAVAKAAPLTADPAGAGTVDAHAGKVGSLAARLDTVADADAVTVKVGQLAAELASETILLADLFTTGQPLVVVLDGDGSLAATVGKADTLAARIDTEASLDAFVRLVLPSTEGSYEAAIRAVDHAADITAVDYDAAPVAVAYGAAVARIDLDAAPTVVPYDAFIRQEVPRG